MFERYTEEARRVIFFSRYEAGQYGSRQIHSEHLLLGLLREGHSLAHLVLPNSESRDSIRREIESASQAPERVRTIEMPLSEESKQILMLAAKESEALGQRFVHPGHILLGILGEENCLAARLLASRGVRLAQVRDKISDHISREEGMNATSRGSWRTGPAERLTFQISSPGTLGPAVDQFVESWVKRDPKRLAALFTPYGQFWDVRGELWLTPTQVEKGLAAHFASSEPQELSPDIRDVKLVTGEVSVATLVWEPQGESKKHSSAALRMVLVFRDAHPGWLIMSAHLALVERGRAKAARKPG
ncbi:MAG TPA: Clp protease N-terminal domain-containing protein [Candidatus Cybelea sp.]|nr:Clp protease N-terminal domain-containing protein [Candidatus Cybelea sp.]